MFQVKRQVSNTRLGSYSVLEAKKKGRGGATNEGAKPRERKEKDDVIEVRCCKHLVVPSFQPLLACHSRVISAKILYFFEPNAKYDKPPLLGTRCCAIVVPLPLLCAPRIFASGALVVMSLVIPMCESSVIWALALHADQAFITWSHQRNTRITEEMYTTGAAVDEA